MANLPVISYKDFVRNPVVGILFLCLIAISYLYVDNKATYKDVITDQEKRIIRLETTVEKLQREISRRDSVILLVNMKLNQIK
jgi:peptidoglycan hydrolase CwlO-like protein